MRFLAVASRPSDYVEMIDLARALVGRAHHVKLLYFYSESARASNANAVGEIESMPVSRDGLSVEAIDVDSLDGGSRFVGHSHGSAAPLESEAQLTMFEKANNGLIRIAVLGRRIGVLDRIPVPIRRLIAIQLVFRLAHWLDAARSYGIIVVSAYGKVSMREFFGLLLAPGEFVRARANQRMIIRFYTGFLEYFAQRIKHEGYDAILIPEDVVGYVWPSLIKAGHEQGIPTLVFPYTLANREEPLLSLRDEPAFHTRNNFLAAQRHPQWRLQARGADLVRLPSSHIFAHQALGISPPDPWMMNSGFANAICVDSRASYEYFLAGGIPASKMRVVGSVSQDHMHELKGDRAAGLAALRRELGLEGEKPLLLLSGCPNQLSAKVPKCEFSDFAAIAAFIGESLRPMGEHYHLVVRPHPNFPEFGPMLEPYGFRSTLVPTSRLVPIADLFIAFASATIRWAIASGVPTVNYDIFGYGYGDFSSATGVLAVDSSERFTQAVRELLPGSVRYQELQRTIAADSAHWSVMDGCCLERIEATIRVECAQRPAPRTAK